MKNTQDSSQIDNLNVLSKEKFLEHQKEKLLNLRENLIARLNGSTLEVLKNSGSGESSTAKSGDSGDTGTDIYDCNLALTFLSKENNAIKQIDDALKKIEEGTYGICEDSGKEIPYIRLEALPFARRTVECQSIYESNKSNNNLQNKNLNYNNLFNSTEVDLSITKNKN